MEEKEIIQNKLDARQKLATMSNEELVKLSENPLEFDRFMSGLASSMNIVFVCYADRYCDIIRKMIANNMSRLEENEKLSHDVYCVLSHLDSYSKESHEYRREFSDQYEALEVHSLGLDRLGMELRDFDKVGADYFRRMTNLEMQLMRSDKNYLATVSYIAKYHPEFMTYTYMLPEIQKTLSHVDKNDFASREEYRAFKKVANKTLSKMSKDGYKIKKEKAKTMAPGSQGYKW